MELIEELSHGIVQPFREQQKERIQRTFVSGADAAGARLKRGIYFLLAIKYVIYYFSSFIKPQSVF